MLSKEEQKKKNTAFWEGFKKYMKGTPSASGRRVNWLNYPTELKDLYVRLVAGGKGCGVYFDIQPKDEEVREVVWEQMGELRVVLSGEMNYQSEWIEFADTTGSRTVSRIAWFDPSLNYFKDEDQEKIYEFLKLRLVGFDQFYQEYKDLLITLIE